MGPARPTVSAPFSLTGRAFALTPFGEFAFDDLLFGRGTATVTLVPYPANPDFAPSWMVDSARFDFAQPGPSPVNVVPNSPRELLLSRTATAAVCLPKHQLVCGRVVTP
jgi:hypothetical protein